jgi:hypothetical protein
VCTSPAASAWYDALSIVASEPLDQLPRQSQICRYCFGAAVVEIVSDHRPLHDELAAFYGDCGCIESPVEATRVRCSATLLEGTPLLSLSFDVLPSRHPVEIAMGIYRFCRNRPYVEVPCPISGWRMVTDKSAEGRLLVASDGRITLINLDLAPPEFVLDCIVGIALAAQPGILFLHAASVGIAGSGALILAPSFGGKSTTALSLASRGHAFLGDDVGAVRLATREVLPFPKSAGLREGPLARSLQEQMSNCRHVRAPARNADIRTVVRVSDLFPQSVSGPLPLRFAFLLDGITGTAKLTPFQPGPDELKRLRSMIVLDAESRWGISPGRDLMQLLTVMDLLSGLRCYLLEVGSIKDTADLIERTMRHEVG